jgi:hypothetical protein
MDKNDVLFASGLVGTVLLLLYLIVLGVVVSVEGRSYGCDKSPRYRIDYIFPARQIACYLYTEVK